MPGFIAKRSVHSPGLLSGLLILLVVMACGSSDEAPEVAEPPAPTVTFLETGIAAYYSDQLDGETTASGELYNRHALTAAHRTLPFGTKVRVTNLNTGQFVTVTVNDRGPYGEARIIDVSGAAADSLGMRQKGVVPVKLEVFE